MHAPIFNSLKSIISTLAPFLAKYSFEIFEVKPIKTFGGSVRVYARKISSNLSSDMPVILYKIELIDLLSKIKFEGRKIIGYGAAGRSNTLLNYCGIDIKFLDYIIDESPSRYGKYTPGTHIPIIPPDKANFKEVDYILILAWNYAEQIRRKVKGFNGKWIIPLPTVQII